MKKLVLLSLAALPLFAAAQVPSYVPTNGLVGWWPFNGNANDESGNGNNGTVNGATLTTDRNGNVNSAYNFDGNGDYVRVTNSPSLVLSNNFSISCWVSISGLNPFNSFLSNASNNQANVTGWVWGYYNYSNPPKRSFQGYPHFNTTTLAQNGNDLPNNVWTNLVVTYELSSSKLKYYLNGILTDTFNITYNISNANLDLFIGNHFQNNDPNANVVNGGFIGGLDDIGIWNRALTPCEIEALYNSGNSGLTLTTSATNLCVSDGSATLLALPSGGTWSGTGVTGNAFNPAVSGAGTFYPVYTVTNASGCVVSDSIAITVDVCAGITENTSSTFTIFPNPANNTITVSWSTADVKTLTLRDAAGRVVRTYNVNGTQAQLSLEGMASGVYFLSGDGEEKVVQKIIKQ